MANCIICNAEIISTLTQEEIIKKRIPIACEKCYNKEKSMYMNDDDYFEEWVTNEGLPAFMNFETIIYCAKER